MERLKELQNVMRTSHTLDFELLKQASELCVSIGSEALFDYWQGYLPRADAVRIISDTIGRIHESAALYFSKIATRMAHEADIDLITSGVSGSRTAEWFQTHNRLFGTNVTASGLALALFHEEVGMTASVTEFEIPRNLTAYVNSMIDTPEAIHGIFHAKVLGGIVSEKEFQQIVSASVGSLYEEFASLSPSGVISPTGTTLLACGLNFFDRENASFILGTFAGAVAGNNKRYLDGGYPSWMQRLGRVCGIMYGGDGPDPHFKLPQFYP